MKVLILSLLSTFLMLTAFSPVASAVNIFPECNTNAANTAVCHSVTSQDTAGSDPILRILKTVINLMSYIIGITAVIVLIIAGLQMIISGDDSQSVSAARNAVIYALVGIVVAVLAQSFVVFVLKNVG